jgi:CheY-like chemotaxis protein
MTSAEFTQHIRFSLQHIYEISVLDKGPGHVLAPWLDQVYPPAEQLSCGQKLHHLLMRTIEGMKPAAMPDANLPRHRSYLILKRRYIDGIPVQQLEDEFNSSSRQFRRDSHRAIEELILLLWDLSPQTAIAAIQSAPLAGGDARNSSLADFSQNISANNLLDLVVDATLTLSVIISSTHTQLTTDIPSDTPPVAADRVALRLALIKLLRLAIAHSPTHTLKIRAVAQADTVTLVVDGVEGLTPQDTIYSEAAQLFTLAEGALSIEPVEQGDAQPGGTRLLARLSTHYHPTVLVIDDDPAMTRIIQRFLALKPIKVVGCTSSDNVIKLVREIQPVLILLDVLMPKRDGWEVLQELKANPDTYHINLAVCSIWDERDLALSLGADMFFQKPLGRAELLACVEKHAHPIATQ